LAFSRYIPENPTYPIVDEILVKEVSDKAIYSETKDFEPITWLLSFKNKTKNQFRII
jgi:hypothetical protein